MKKFFAVFLSAVMLISLSAVLTGCGSESADTDAAPEAAASSSSASLASEDEAKEAQKAFENLIAALKAVDMTEAGKYIDTGDLPGTSGEASGESDAAIQAVFSNINAEIVSCKAVSPDEAEIVSNISTINLMGVFGQCVQIVMTEYMDEYVSGALTDDGLDEKVDEIFSEEVAKKGLPTATNQVNVRAKKIDGSWKIKMSSELQNAISGGFWEELKSRSAPGSVNE